MSAVVEQFRDALRLRSIVPPVDLIADGLIHRCDAEGSHGQGDASYVLHLDGLPAGGFQNWRDGRGWENWRADIGRQVSSAEQEAHTARIVAMRAQREEEDARRRADARKRASDIWEAAQPAPADHLYLLTKGVQSYGLRLHNTMLVVPMRDSAGELQSLQFIAEDGAKKFLPGGRVAGSYFVVGGPDSVVCVAEGYSTAASIHAATGHAVLVAFSATNLEAVATTAAQMYPGQQLILCADDDYRTEGNPGVAAAGKAALAVGGLVAIPSFNDARPEGATDFNDLYRLEGGEAVQRDVGDGKSPKPIADAARTDLNAIAGRSEHPSMKLIRGADIIPRPVRWLWDGWLAVGKLQIMAGPAGTGKTTLAMALAAAITVGGRLPDGTDAKPGNVLVWSGEDDISDTLVTRLRANGADMNHVYFVGDVTERNRDRSFDPSKDLPVLLEEAEKVGNVVLTIVDPVVSAVAGDSHKNTEVRRGLQPLLELAVRLECAVLGISHFSKGTGGRNPTERVTGSLAFAAVPRLVIAVARSQSDDAEEQKGVMVRCKSNNGPDSGGFAYELVQQELAQYPGIFASYVKWGDAVVGSAAELLAQADGDGPPEENESPRQFLKTLLESGPKRATDIFDEAEAQGYSRPQMGRAATALRVAKKKLGMGDGWQWRLSEDDARTEDAHTEEASPSSSSSPSKMTLIAEDAEDDGKSCWEIPSPSVGSSIPDRNTEVF